MSKIQYGENQLKFERSHENIVLLVNIKSKAVQDIMFIG